MKKCTGTNYDREHCEVEKMGCNGCYYYRDEEETIDEQKVSKHSKSKSNSTNRES